jgi:hypothetical protein
MNFFGSVSARSSVTSVLFHRQPSIVMGCASNCLLESYGAANWGAQNSNTMHDAIREESSAKSVYTDGHV